MQRAEHRLGRLRSESGVATFIAIIMIVMLTLIGLAVLSTSDDELEIAANQLHETRTFYAAEAGLERITASIMDTYDRTGKPPDTMPGGAEEINRCLVSYTTELGVQEQTVLTRGSLSGLNALVQPYIVTSTAVGGSDMGRIDLTENFEVALIPIFQWAVFFQEDLWAQPAYDMNITGRVHVNGNMYLRCSQSLVFEDRVTCAGKINAGFPYSKPRGDVRFTDADGNEVSMQQSGQWIDNSHSEWYDTSAALWGGMVQDEAYGQPELNLPLSSGGPHKLIERGASNDDSFEHKASVKIIDGDVYEWDGSNWNDITSALPSGTVTCDATTTFYDAHEREYVRNTEIDMDKLRTSGHFPDNGVIYISDQRSTSGSTGLNATTLTNGEQIGYPLTVACENPVYVEGDFNTKSKQPVAVIADATTFLSNNWDPSRSGPSYKYTSRPVSSKTEVNLCILTGDLAPAGTNYGGGLENLPRFLEDWRSTEFKFRGSMIEGFRSKQATGTWRYPPTSDAYYTAPSRNWGYDTDLDDPNKLPPMTPMVRVFQRTGWQQQHVTVGAGAYEYDTD